MTLFPCGLGTCTVRFDVAAGPWQTVQAWGQEPGAIGNGDGSSFIFGATIATAMGTVLSVTHDIKDTPVRLVAIDREGKEHVASPRSGSGVKNFRQLVGEFDVPPDRINGFLVQVRAYQTAEVPGIALNPSGPD